MKYAKNGLRERQSNWFKRIITKHTSVSTIYTTLTSIYHMKVKAPHFWSSLIYQITNTKGRVYLISKELQCIVEVWVSNNIYGKQLNIHQNKRNIGRGLKPFQHNNVSKFSKRIIVINVDKDECNRLLPNTFTFPRSIVSISMNKETHFINMSEKVALLVGTMHLKQSSITQ